MKKHTPKNKHTSKNTTLSHKDKVKFIVMAVAIVAIVVMATVTLVARNSRCNEQCTEEAGQAVKGVLSSKFAPTTTECSDGKDNDGDGKCDYCGSKSCAPCNDKAKTPKGDPDCSSIIDNSEYPDEDQLPFCEDSDSGMSVPPRTRGVVVAGYPEMSYTDECVSFITGRYVTEHYCDAQSEHKVEYYSCSDCDDGVCRKMQELHGPSSQWGFRVSGCGTTTNMCINGYKNYLENQNINERRVKMLAESIFENEFECTEIIEMVYRGSACAEDEQNIRVRY